MTRLASAFAAVVLTISMAGPAVADFVGPPSLDAAVAAGTLPPIDERLPDSPLVVDMEAAGLSIGQSGGEVTWIARRVRDIRIMNVYGYSRLVGYTPDFELAPDILDRIEVEDERVFTLHLRPGHRWSDGHPFTTEDFRFEWFDVQLNEELKPYGPSALMIVDGELPTVEVLDDYTIRYSWSQPNPSLLPAVAGARPLYLYAPAHYLRQFHTDYADPDDLAALIDQHQERDWISLFIRRSNLYEANNVDLPTLQPWVNTVPPPADRFEFVRNPYFHRVDSTGQQLPYLDRVIVRISDASLIPAQTGAGEADLQARSLSFDNIAFLIEGQERNNYTVHLWPTAVGSEIALYPNMNAEDPVWREVIRDVRFRRALSLAIDRDRISRVLFFELATPANNTALPTSPFFDEGRTNRWATLDILQANSLLDEMGLIERNADGVRLLPDGRPLEIVVETAGERPIEVDALQLIGNTWREIGVSLFIASAQRDVFRTRVFSGEAIMSTWWGLDNAQITTTTLPTMLAPVDQNFLQYPKWGQYVQTDGTAGEPPDMPFGARLMELYQAWQATTDVEERTAIVDEMLDIHADEVTSIGTVQGVLQPVVVRNTLRNVPEEALYSWNPGAHFGVYRPDTFWIDR